MNNLILETAKDIHYCVIWLHGLGASANDMAGLAKALDLGELPMRHVCLQAPLQPVTINHGMSMPAWYDIVGDNLTDREDSKGIAASERIIADAVEEQIKSGISSKNIIIAGFSQGGAMALHAGLQYAAYLGGVVALSSYLPLRHAFTPCQRKTLPIFFAYGSDDFIVRPEWSRLSVDALQQAGFSRITAKVYPMAHEVNSQEMNDLRSWLLGRVLN